MGIVKTLVGIATAATLSVLTVAGPAHGQAASAPPPPAAANPDHRLGQADLAPMRTGTGELAKLSERTSNIEAELATFKSWAGWGATIAGALFALVGFFGWQSVRDFIRRIVEHNLESQLKTALSEALPSKLADVQGKAEDYLLRFAQLLALHGLHHHDEALAAYGWDGSVPNLRKESPTIRRVIIESLHSSREERKERRQAAWEALTELLNDDSSIETKRLYLRISYATRRIAEGVAFVDKHVSEIKTDQEAALRAATLLRKVNRQEDALALVEGVYDSADLECVVHAAALQRDLGNFDEAHDVLTPSVSALVSDPKTRLPEGWHRLLNTYIANCLDRRRPDDGVRPVEFVLRSAPGAVEVFTVGRLIKALAPSHPSRNELLSRFNAAIDGLAPGEARLRCEVLQQQMNGNVAEAERLLHQSLKVEGQTARTHIDSDTYFQHCTLGEFYIDTGRPDDAIDVLMPAAGATYGGEAKFYLSVAYATKSENRDSARWLTLALQELPKWAAHARDHPALRSVPEVAEVLASYTRGKRT